MISLQEQLEQFGGGIELSLLCAVPKGSGLGTSSNLAATVLAALSELCGWGWDLTEIGNRTLALEQMLTSGGGGYLLVMTSDAHAAARLRSTLEKNPPNDRARFVDFELSYQGLQVTRS